MLKFDSIQDIIDFAIEEEQKSIDIFTELSQKSINYKLRMLLEQLIRDEIKHKEQLQNLGQTLPSDFNTELIGDFSYFNDLNKPIISPDNTVSEALTLIIKAEDIMSNFYNKLGNYCTNPEYKKMFFQISEEEKKHKRLYEYEFNELIKMPK